MAQFHLQVGYFLTSSTFLASHDKLIQAYLPVSINKVNPSQLCKPHTEETYPASHSAIIACKIVLTLAFAAIKVALNDSEANVLTTRAH